jgi:prepilin-type N-terminal cleavage/methylation domain-containing protein
MKERRKEKDMICEMPGVNRKGFTLLELVSVIMLIAVLMVTMFGALDQVRDNEERSRQSKDEEKEAYLLFHRLSPLFKNMSTYKLYSGREYADYFRGTGRGMVFLSRSPLVSPFRTVHIVELMFDRGRILYREKALRPKDQGQPFSFMELKDEPFIPLLEQLDAAVFQYLVWDNRAGDWVWKPQLNSFDKDPSPDEVMVRLRIKGKAYMFTFPRAIVDKIEEAPGDLFQ